MINLDDVVSTNWRDLPAKEIFPGVRMRILWQGANGAKAKILEFSKNSEMRSVQEPIAFGIKALKITFVMEESKGSTDSLEESIKTIEGVNSVETIDVRRAIG